MSVEHPTFYSLPTGQDARFLAQRTREAMRADEVLVHIALDEGRAQTLLDLLAFFAPDVEVVFFPAWDCLPYDRVSPAAHVLAARAAGLCRMLAWQGEQARRPRLVITTVNAALQRVPPQNSFRRAGFYVQKGGRLNLDDLQAYLVDNGYTRTETVRESGEYSIRGGIIDLFPPSADLPVRFDLFGDEVETIRYFDPVTQRSGEGVGAFSLTPVSELYLNDEAISKFRAGYRSAFGVVQPGVDALYDAVSAGRRHNGMEHWIPLFYEGMTSLFDYMPKHVVLMDLHVRRSHTQRLDQIADFYQARKTLEDAAKRSGKGVKGGGKSQDVSLSGAAYHPLPAEALYLTEAEWLEATAQGASLSPFQAPPDAQGQGQAIQALSHDMAAHKGRNFADVRAQQGGHVFDALKTHLAAERKRTLIACYSAGSQERIRTMMEAADFDQIVSVPDVQALKKLQPYQVGLCVLTLEDGFDAPDLRLLTEQDLLGDRLARRTKKSRKADDFITEIAALEAGDYVVHVDHGVGRFLALETVKAGKTLHDCLKIEYAGGDRLFVPVENIEVLSRFGDSESAVQLDRLGGAGWQARKAKAKKDLMEMADHLLKIAAARQLKKAPSLHISEGLYNEFASRFPYSETEDQLRAIDKTLKDMGKSYPMDRLVCGDVGFGKTEVAIRAAYVAAMNGVQVALIAPTTLLARQHYKNFCERFAGTGLRIDQFSRLVQARVLDQSKQDLARGSVNIAIGTHALFAKGIGFDNLGLVIIDEEQRFGVKQKERLKELKENVHVLTLTATPIPRTLQMSLTGVKEMSLIATPPVDRLAVRTFVLPYDPVVVREALLREHYRGGQSFYVCPRIKDMDAIEAALKDLVPEVKVITAHGQMPPSELEDRMNAFYDGQYGLLLATNIIESGIDIPSANTMIIHRADLFGLAQLYQIRGRIGRSKQRAYAYLTYSDSAPLGDTALKRLEVMETLDTLGAGFQLASHDMDIRGAGNLLGDKQSGHIKEVGVELYQQMLEDAVAAARAGQDYEDDEAVSGAAGEERWTPQINLGTSVLIPEGYVTDLSVRMTLYRRLGDLDTAEDIDAFAVELIDRFGDLPEEVKNLIEIVGLKQLCRQAGIAQIDAGAKGVVIAFRNNAPPNVDGLMGWITSKSGLVKLRPDQKISVLSQWDSSSMRVRGVKSLVQDLARLAI